MGDGLESVEVTVGAGEKGPVGGVWGRGEGGDERDDRKLVTGGVGGGSDGVHSVGSGNGMGWLGGAPKGPDQNLGGSVVGQGWLGRGMGCLFRGVQRLGDGLSGVGVRMARCGVVARVASKIVGFNFTSRVRVGVGICYEAERVWGSVREDE